MKNKASIWAYIMVGVAWLFGVIYIASLVFLPVGIYCISGASLYLAAAKLTDGEVYALKKRLGYYAIFFSIVAFPLGLISIIVYAVATSNHISVETPTDDAAYTVTDADEQQTGFNDSAAQGQNTSGAEAEGATQAATQPHQVVLTEEAFEKFEELKEYRNQGLITEAEFNRAKKDLFGE